MKIKVEVILEIDENISEQDLNVIMTELNYNFSYREVEEYYGTFTPEEKILNTEIRDYSIIK